MALIVVGWRLVVAVCSVCVYAVGMDTLRVGRHEKRGRHERDLRLAEAWLADHPLRAGGPVSDVQVRLAGEGPMTTESHLTAAGRQVVRSARLWLRYPGPRVG